MLQYSRAYQFKLLASGNTDRAPPAAASRIALLPAAAGAGSEDYVFVFGRGSMQDLKPTDLVPRIMELAVRNPAAAANAVDVAAVHLPVFSQLNRDVELLGDAARVRFVRVDDPLHINSVSRVHFAIKRFASKWMIADLSTCNGVYLNSVRLERCHWWTVLPEGATIGFAPSTQASKRTSDLLRAHPGEAATGDAALARLAFPKLLVKDVHLEFTFTSAVAPAVAAPPAPAAAAAAAAPPASLPGGIACGAMALRSAVVAAPPSPPAAAAAAPAPESKKRSRKETEAASKHLGPVAEELTCGICADLIHQCVSLSCSHMFCKNCITPWLAIKRTCPNCRQLQSFQPKPMPSIDSIVQGIVASAYSADEKKERAERVERAKFELAQKEAEGLATDRSAALQLIMKADRPMVQLVIGRLVTAPLVRPAAAGAAAAPATLYHVDHAASRDTLCHACCGLIHPEALRLRVSKGAEAATHFHLVCYTACNSTAAPVLSRANLQGVPALNAGDKAAVDAILKQYAVRML